LPGAMTFASTRVGASRAIVDGVDRR
jgi:hypothetical protein